MTVFKLSVLATALVATVIVTATLATAPPANMGNSDKFFHGLAFAMLALPLAFSRPRQVLSVVVFAMVFGAMIELIQPYFGRQRDFADIVANFWGTLLGAGMGFGLSALRKKLESKV